MRNLKLKLLLLLLCFYRTGLDHIARCRFRHGAHESDEEEEEEIKKEEERMDCLVALFVLSPSRA
jgi:hypothetical protein